MAIEASTSFQVKRGVKETAFMPMIAVLVLTSSRVSAEHSGTEQATNSEPAEQAPYYRPSDASTRIVVVAPEETFAARVRGQVSDLDAEVVSHTESIAGTWSEQGERARSLARSADQTLVAWLSEMPAPPGATASDASRTFVAVFFSSTGRLYARAVGPPLTTASDNERSATLELAALTVRAALRSVAEADSLGVPLGAVSSVPPRQGSTTGVERKTPHVPVAETDGERATLRGLIGAAALLHADGVTGLGLPGVRIGLGFQRERLRTFTAGEWSPPRALSAAGATLRVQRALFDVESQLALTDPERSWVAYAGGALGVAAFYRTTDTTTSVSGTPPNTSWSLLVRGIASLEWRLKNDELGQRLLMRAGVDFISAAPVFELVETNSDSGTIRRYPLSRLQPFAGVGWLALW